MSAELRNRKRLERLRRQADALLDLTQVINRNVPDEELFGGYRRVLEGIGVGKLALFCRHEADGAWDCVVEWGYPARLPRLEDAGEALSGKSHAIVSGGTEVEYDLAIPVEQDGEVIAYVVMGDREEGRGMSPSIRHVRFITTLTNVLVDAPTPPDWVDSSRIQSLCVRESDSRIVSKSKGFNDLNSIKSTS